MQTSRAANLPTGLEGDILKSLSIPLAVIDCEFRFLWLNQEMARIYQSRPKQATGKICYELISAEAGPCHDCPVAAVQKSGRREISQKYRNFPDGARKYYEVSAFPIHDAQKKVVATLLMILDMSHKVVVALDPAYQMLAQSMSAPLEWMPQSLKLLGRERMKKKARQSQAVNLRLTPRETQVMQLLVKGSSNTQIASRLKISPHTVKSHVTNIFNKLGVNDRIQAAVVVTKQGIVE
jgi:DNA-binding CsgD family transcriptional regulator